jgi:hypothetical protein
MEICLIGINCFIVKLIILLIYHVIMVRAVLLLATAIVGLSCCTFRLGSHEVHHFAIRRLHLHLVSHSSHHVDIF